MEQHDFDDLMAQARQVAKQLAGVYRDVTGEELDLESMVRHSPLVAVGIAAGFGALGGWFVARRTQRQLPPPKPAPNPLESVERLLPEGIEKVREILPGVVPDDAADVARAWMEEVLEPKLKEGVDNVVANVGETRLGMFIRQTIQRLETGEDRTLDDPE
jgi:hypothetical protein